MSLKFEQVKFFNIFSRIPHDSKCKIIYQKENLIAIQKMYSLTHFSPVSHFYTPWKRQKTFCFLTFSGGIEIWHCTALKWVKHLKVTVSELFRKQITFVRVEKSSTLIGFAQLQSFEKVKQTNKWINKITFLILACFDSDLSFIYN